MHRDKIIQGIINKINKNREINVGDHPRTLGTGIFLGTEDTEEELDAHAVWLGIGAIVGGYSELETVVEMHSLLF